MAALLFGAGGFAQEPDSLGENIQSPQLRKEITQLREKVNQSKAAWKFIGYSGNPENRSDLVFYDSSGIDKLGDGIFRVWIKNTKAAASRTFEKDTETVKPFIAKLLEIDMKNKKQRAISTAVHKSNGDIDLRTGPTKWEYIGTGSTYETLYKILKLKR